NYATKPDKSSNVIDLANDAGMKTYWISNQAKIGQSETQVSAIASRAHYQYYKNTSYDKAEAESHFHSYYGVAL
ncbi:hypothetical protein AB4182_23860, partial [Vibrio splendidus]